ncbi:hypothetical protein AGLY_005397 [Aphis glycines]|uniref:P/Homo B domain-containing protein n=1 Tax=Aphis glycines TaxID=307491 RepID=A0A6G0TTV1_APHGL|nr:hypothetical protein AGLY_005397 [Aphis glycines]
MRLSSTLLLLVFNACVLSAWASSDSDVKYFTNEWLAHVPLGEMVARKVARDVGMRYDGPDIGNDGFHRMIKTELPSKSFNNYEAITHQLNNHEFVTIASQEAVKARSYRGVVQPRHVVSRSVVPRSNSLERNRKVTHRSAGKISNYQYAFNDEFWPDMWYFQDIRTNEKDPVLDMNIVPVFFELGITGHGVNITVPDDGLEWTHPDILPKFNPDVSWNYISNNNEIMPDRDGNGGYRSHGTRCAGEIIMQPDNDVCGVGTAYGASLGGIKFLDDGSTDTREAKVLKYALNYVCIYSNSWGPADTGTFMEHLTDFVKRSLSKGIHQGRDGKGAIYVFAAGNGKTEGDNCACDGYVNSIYTIVIASCDDSGHVAHYSERCASIMATAYSGSGQEKNVLTTDVKGKCTASHTGTSAAAPLVSGIIALALSANPELSWRDIQHLIAWTAQVAPLSDNYGWNRNKAGFFYSVDFGFGLVNAYRLVQEAMKWENVPEMSSCGIRMPKVKGYPVSRNRAARITVYSNGCEGLSGEIKYLEYVQLVLSMTYPKRGDIQIAMKSPLGTECHVLESRSKDFNTRGLKRWTFSILAFWGESPKGNFVIDIYDTTGKPSNKGKITEITLSLHGTKDKPKIYQNGYRPYDAFKLAKPGDKPRFTNLSLSSVKSLERPKVQKRPNVTNRYEFQTEDETKNQVLNDEMLQQNILLAMEQEVANQEDAIIEDITLNTMMNTVGGLERELFDGVNDLDL